MTLDFADKLAANGDIVLVRSDKYRAYNLLAKANLFIDNPAIGLDIAGMVQAGIADSQIEDRIAQYLVNFDCEMKDAMIESNKGTIKIDYDFGGSYVQS